MTAAEFFLGSKSSVIHIETLEISHPDFSQTHWIVRNVIGGITLTLETAASQAFTYYPCRLSRLSAAANLDQGLSVTFGDIGTVLNAELEAIEVANSFSTKPTVKYRSWRSDHLTEPMIGPIALTISKISMNFEGATFNAHAPRLNVSATGELYRLERFPMLRGSL